MCSSSVAAARFNACRGQRRLRLSEAFLRRAEVVFEDGARANQLIAERGARQAGLTVCDLRLLVGRLGAIELISRDGFVRIEIPIGKIDSSGFAQRGLGI